MPPVAVALIAGMLLHAGSLLSIPSLSFESTLSLSSGQRAPTSLASLPASPDSPSASFGVFDPDDGNMDPTKRPKERWVAPHTQTSLWATADPLADEVGVAHQWGPLQVVGASQGQRLPVWDPSTRLHGWIDAGAVGPIDPALIGTGYLPPIGRPVAWSGAARITMYTCVELGGCAPTASGIWPEPGMVAVDPSVIPLGSTVWIQGLGTFLAADTGSLVRGAHIDVFGLSYQDALTWGVQQRTILVYPPR
jgi:3D (Asp-Asp-Asp) domain-containing protein